MEWLTAQIVLTLGSVACLSATFLLYLRIRRWARRFEAHLSRHAAEISREWTRHREHLDQRLAEVEEVAQMLTAAPASTRQGITPQTRGQALEMLRRGAGPEQVAAALAIPLHEVRLLRTVQKIVLSQL
ncbi:MAG: hypothetical protein IPM24_01005 [Bryobacterales bacterium]|nr:hypothetical protein [Bryobacterales bacterium]